MPDALPNTLPADPASTGETSPFRYIVTEGLAELLTSLNCTLAATTYQAGKLAFFRADQGTVSALFRTFDTAMGLAVSDDRLAIGTRNSIWMLHNAPEIGRQLKPLGKHDACYVPRNSHVTGDIRVHELAWCTAAGAHSHAAQKSTEPELWFVNTRFSCLCTLHPEYSFVPRWRPAFVTAHEPEDRCHLNGLAVEHGRPAYVTALGPTDVKEGWRDNKSRGGILVDVSSNETISTELAMPHSPRLHHGELFLLNSGLGTLEIVDRQTGHRETVIRLPGYARGLAFVGKYAFIGLSKIRDKHEFGGLPIEQSGEPLKCGIVCADLERGRIIEWIEFEAGCEEIFDVQLIRDARYATVVGLQKDTIDGVFVLPPVQSERARQND